MRDINFFNIYKRKKGKSKGLRIFITVILVLLLVGNALMVGAYLFISKGLQANIQELDALIHSEDTQAKIDEANRLKAEAALTSEYLMVLRNSADKLKQMDLIDTTLLDKVRQLTPLTTRFTIASYEGTQINLECWSALVTDPMDMYHAFRNDPSFATVSLSAIVVDASGSIAFSLYCQLAGGTTK